MIGKIKRRQSGITLIALVLTVIILLILSGIVISELVGDEGLIGQSKNAKSMTDKASVEEELNTIWYDIQRKTVKSNLTVEEMSQELLEELQPQDPYVSITYIEPTNKYKVIYKGYEFEI